MKLSKENLQEMFKNLMTLLNKELSTMIYLREFDACIDFYKNSTGFLFKHYINKSFSISAEKIDDELQISLIYKKEEENIYIIFPNIEEQSFDEKYIWFLYSYLNMKNE